MTKFCNICGKLEAETLTRRLVRDHNHKTGYIRGLLCDDCNGKIGTYESTNPYISKYKNKVYWVWYNTYKDRILYHLSCNTGIKYIWKPKEKESRGYFPRVKGKLPGSLPLPRIKNIGM